MRHFCRLLFSTPGGTLFLLIITKNQSLAPTMTLTLDTFIPMLSRFPHEELLDPVDSQKLQLLTIELLVDHTVDLPLLKYLSRFLTPALYDDLVEERNIEHVCGYITCDRLPKSRRLLLDHGHIAGAGGDDFQIYARKPLIILPNTYLSQYCCKQHYQSLVFFRNQLSEEAIFARANIMVAPPFPKEMPLFWYENGITCLEEILARQRQDPLLSLSEVISKMAGLHVDDEEDPGTNKLIDMIHDFEIVEKENPQPDYGEGDEEEGEDNGGGYKTSARAWGGYVV